MREIRKIVFTCFAFAMCFTPVFAREIGYFDNFEVTGKFWNKTEYLTKCNDYGYIVNLENSRNHAGIRILQCIVNSNGDERSDRQYATCGYRYAFADRTTRGYVYALKLKRENFIDGKIRILGSWSPDEA